MVDGGNQAVLAVGKIITATGRLEESNARRGTVGHLCIGYFNLISLYDGLAGRDWRELSDGL